MTPPDTMTTRDTMTTAAAIPPGMFISCDWGTSAFRLHVIDSAHPSAMDPAHKFSGLHASGVLATLATDAGIAATYADWQRSGLPETERVAFYRAVLERAIGQLAEGNQTSGESREGMTGERTTGDRRINKRTIGQPPSGIDLDGVPVIISGMASSSIGMLELSYRSLPFDASGVDLVPTILPATAASPRVIYLMPGVQSTDDVMRGEETQLVGCGISAPGEQIVVFPGTHSKHILVRDGEAVEFKTYMTGEIFGLLANQSILAASVARPDEIGPSAAPATGVDLAEPASGSDAVALPDAFFAGIAAACTGSLLHNAFLTRTNQLFSKYSKEDNYHYLSGLLIGEELRELMEAPGAEDYSTGLAADGRSGRTTSRELARPKRDRSRAASGETNASYDSAMPNSLRSVTLVASSPLRESYAAALSYLGFRQVAAIDADTTLIAGHCVLFARFGATIASKP